MNSITIKAGDRIKVMYRLHEKSKRGLYGRKSPFDETILEKGQTLYLDALKDDLIDIVRMEE